MNTSAIKCRITSKSTYSGEYGFGMYRGYSYTNSCATLPRSTTPFTQNAAFSVPASPVLSKRSNIAFSSWQLNSTPSLTPSASPSIGGARKPSAPAPASQNGPKPNAPPPPPPPSNSKPQVKAQHPVVKPPPPPAPGGSNPPARPPARAQSFNQGRQSQYSPDSNNRGSKDDFQMAFQSQPYGDNDGPVPPIRTVSHGQSNTIGRRRPGPAPPPPPPIPPGGVRPTRGPPMKPPSQPPPPPPVGNPPPPPHRTQPAPPPPPMQTTQVRMVNMNHEAVSSMSNPPTPPTRRHSLRQNGNGYASSSSNSGSETFENRFAHRFKSPQFLPPPEPFSGCAKTYPSKSQGQGQQLPGRQGSMVKRAPAPPPPPQKGAPPPPAAPPMWGSAPLRT